LQDGPEGGGTGIFGEGGVFAIFDDADDLVLVPHAIGEVLAYGVGCAEEATGEGLVDDDDEWGFGVVLRGEGAAAE